MVNRAFRAWVQYFKKKKIWLSEEEWVKKKKSEEEELHLMDWRRTKNPKVAWFLGLFPISLYLISGLGLDFWVFSLLDFWVGVFGVYQRRTGLISRFSLLDFWVGVLFIEEEQRTPIGSLEKSSCLYSI